MFLVILSLIQLVHAKNFVDVDGWSKTDFPAALLAQFIDNAKCHSSPEYLQSCRQALKAGQILAGVHVDADQAMEFEEALGDLEEELDNNIPSQLLRSTVVNAHLSYFDAHSRIEPSRWVTRKYKALGDTFVGIGVVLESGPDGVTVVDVLPGSPADKAGVKVDDVVFAVGKRANVGAPRVEVGSDLEKAAELLMDNPGTDVSLKILRMNSPLEFTVRRASVNAPLVTSEQSNGFGYLRIHSFDSDSVCKLVSRHLQAMSTVRGLVLDLRGNPGGEKAMAICVAELFVGPKPIVGTKRISLEVPSLRRIIRGERTRTTSAMVWESGNLAKPKFAGPLVVLVDGFTASASEIVAGALQDYERAWIVGERTSGKGTVQLQTYVPNFPSLTLSYTVERFYQPKGRSNQGVGISPSFEVGRRRATQSLRETELYPTALPPENLPWVETRPLEAAAIRRCLNLRQDSDQQKAFAFSVLSCM